MASRQHSAAAMLATMLFPRSASMPWRIKFDSATIEKNFSKSISSQDRSSLLQTLVALLGIFVAWLVFTSTAHNLSATSVFSPTLPIIFATVVAALLLILAVFAIAHFRYRFHCRYILLAFSLSITVVVAIVFISPSIVYQLDKNADARVTVLPADSQPVTAVGVLCLHGMAVSLIYTMLTLPASLAFAVSAFLTIILEGLFAQVWQLNWPITEATLPRIFSYIVLHSLGIVVRLQYESRLRTGFWYGAQALIASQRLDVEKRLRQRLILSIMPQAFAENIFSPKKRKTSRYPSNRSQSTKQQPVAKKTTKDDTCDHSRLSQSILSSFRPKPATTYWLPEPDKDDVDLLHEYHMEKFECVSIIFANICGFTNISSKKKPDEWVPLLNDILDRFDAVCKAAGCEKISILGDRYICLSGCPTPRSDHAHCCIEAGLGMCRVIKVFNANHNEDLSVHVGIHTGTVQCGLFGTKRYKFDIWGDDVNFSNDVMESSDRPGHVLVSADTYPYVKDDFILEECREIDDLRKSSLEMTETFDPVTKRMVFSSKKTTQTFFVIDRQAKCRYQKLDSNNEIILDTCVKTDDASPSKVPLLTNQNEEANCNDAATKATSPTSFTEPPVQPLALYFTAPQVESDYNNRVAYDSLPTNDETWAGIDASSKPLELDPLYVGGSGWVGSAVITQTPKSNKKGDNDCAVNSGVFPIWLAYGDVATSVIAIAVLLIVCVTAFPPSDTTITLFAVLPSVTIVLLLLYPVLPSLPKLLSSDSDQDQKNNASSSSVNGKLWRGIQIALGSYFSLFPALVLLLVLTMFKPLQQSMLPSPSDVTYISAVIASLLHFVLFFQVPHYIRTALVFIEVAVFATATGLAVNIWQSDQNSPAHVTCVYVETVLGLLSIAVIVGLAARRIELSARLAWYAAVENRVLDCAAHKAQKQNDELLAYVVPLHVLDRFSQQCQQHFYQHHPNCGVIVVQIANFADYYEETFSGRDAILHVLNEIFSEFEALLLKRRFKDVEKVKTSVPSLLCAAGLDAHRRTMQREKTAHLYALMAYCFELVETMRKFNEPRQFKFKMRIGFDMGDLVSGILGSTLLHYDVWGDTVNLANKMCFLGGSGENVADKEGVILVSEEVAELLQGRFNFEEGGTIFMSGKGDIKTYLAVSEKPMTYEHLAPPPGSKTEHFDDE